MNIPDFDRWITGNYGEDSVPDDDGCEHNPAACLEARKDGYGDCCSQCWH